MTEPTRPAVRLIVDGHRVFYRFCDSGLHVTKAVALRRFSPDERQITRPRCWESVPEVLQYLMQGLLQTQYAREVRLTPHDDGSFDIRVAPVRVSDEQSLERALAAVPQVWSIIRSRLGWTENAAELLVTRIITIETSWQESERSVRLTRNFLSLVSRLRANLLRRPEPTLRITDATPSGDLF